MWNSIETPQNEIAHCVSHTHNAFFFFSSLFLLLLLLSLLTVFFFLFVLLKLSPFHFSNQARDGRKRKGVTKIQKKKEKKTHLSKSVILCLVIHFRRVFMPHRHTHTSTHNYIYI